MDLYNASAFTRRQFLHSGLTLASAAATIPWFLNSSALGMPRPLPGMTSMPGIPEDHVLVVIQLSGGNDGLNTVIPYGMGAYYKARPGIGIQAGQALKLKEVDGIGLHAQRTFERFDRTGELRHQSVAGVRKYVTVRSMDFAY